MEATEERDPEQWEHRLVLPLPPAFATTTLPGDANYSSFRSAAGRGEEIYDRPSYATLRAYVDELCQFLEDYRLVQYHPEQYFQYVLGSTQAESPLEHRDGLPVTEKESQEMLALCNAFIPYFPCGGDGTEASIWGIHELIQDGPVVAMDRRRKAGDIGKVDKGGERPAECNPALAHYFETTQRLMMWRHRRVQNDAASLTLLPASDPRPQCGCDSSLDGPDEVMEHLLDFGMGPKKRHEVEIMRSTMHDLVKNCCVSSEGDQASVSTIINIGEGKGYVSRVLAMRDGFQVVGLDCNPHHKEKYLERTEYLLEGNLGRRSATGEIGGVNMLYLPRGRMASIACRVGPQADWRSLLEGHIDICDEVTGERIPAQALTRMRGSTCDTATSPPNAVDVEVDKVQCMLCGKIMRRSGTGALLGHAQVHFRRDCPDEPLAALWRHAGGRCSDSQGASLDPVQSPTVSFPTTRECTEWVSQMTHVEYVAKVVATFFADQVQLKKSREGKPLKPCESQLEPLRARRVLVRGTRVRLMFVAGGPVPPPPTDASMPSPGPPQPVMATILGFDSATKMHQLVCDGATKKLMVQLVFSATDTCSSLPMPSAATGGLGLPLHTAAEVLEVVPFPEERTATVLVPSLSNTALMGLHPCGDLGASVCRIFLASRSAGLLLVSCCWHALTNDAFPLSAAFRRKGLRTESLSLMLATQPLDMWASASSEGHHGSLRLLFQRSLLHYLWCALRQAYEGDVRRAASMREGLCTDCGRCPLVDLPHLEPSFLRRMSKVKSSVTFEELYVAVVKEYLVAGAEDPAVVAEGRRLPHATARPKWNYWPHQCPLCQQTQLRFLLAPRATDMAKELFSRLEPPHFRPFVGLTVLRMWASHVVETILLMDRALYLHESLVTESAGSTTPSRGSAVSLAPLFDGKLSPRMYGILAHRR